MTTQKILFITPYKTFSLRGAREGLGLIQFYTLNELFGDRIFLMRTPKRTSKKIFVYNFNMLKALCGNIDGVSPEFIKLVLETIDHLDIDTVYLDGSNLGKVAKSVRHQYPFINIVTFFHNIEFMFFLHSFRSTFSLKSFILAIIHFYVERWATRVSNRTLTLNQRDSRLLKKIYGRAATDHSLFTVSVPPRGERRDVTDSKLISKKYCLFVGSAFYANVEGITWYLKYVAQTSGIDTVIIGRGFERYRNALQSFNRTHVLGEVENLSIWYENALFVIAPIFSGSGMKTKIAEALYYGKKVVGSREAFVGYERHLPVAGVVCSSADDFRKAISNFVGTLSIEPYQELKEIFEQHYSLGAFRKRMADIFGSP